MGTYSSGGLFAKIISEVGVIGVRDYLEVGACSMTYSMLEH